MTIPIPEEFQAFIAAQVGSGRYQSESEVVERALFLLEEHELGQEAMRREFNEELERRLDSLDRGEYLSEDEVKTRLQHVIQRATRQTA